MFSRAGHMFGLTVFLLAAQVHLNAWTDETIPILVGEMVQRGLVDCFATGLETEAGEPAYCEASAVVFDGTDIILASDKPVPGKQRSAVFSFNYPDHGRILGSPTYLTAKPYLEAIKYEDMSLSIDAAYVIATTGFDRVKSDTADWDGYNTMLLWPVGKPDAVRVISAGTNAGVTSSVSLRETISRVLSTADFPRGVPYFKVESVAIIPGQTLLLGIREAGADYLDFVYTATIIAAQFTIEDGNFVFTSDFEVVYEFEPSADPLIPQQTGLASIEYDRYNDRLYLLTSYELAETDEGMGGYLWVLPMADLSAGKPPTLVLKESGGPLHFAHKPEGVAVLAENLVLVINDDDRTLGRDIISNPETQFSKGAHQAAYTLVSLAYLTPEVLPAENAGQNVPNDDPYPFPAFYWLIITFALLIAWLLVRSSAH